MIKLTEDLFCRLQLENDSAQKKLRDLETEKETILKEKAELQKEAIVCFENKYYDWMIFLIWKCLDINCFKHIYICKYSVINDVFLRLDCSLDLLYIFIDLN